MGHMGDNEVWQEPNTYQITKVCPGKVWPENKQPIRIWKNINGKQDVLPEMSGFFLNSSYCVFSSPGHSSSLSAA
jgi:hypothetical protein